MRQSQNQSDLVACCCRKYDPNDMQCPYLRVLCCAVEKDTAGREAGPPAGGTDVPQIRSKSRRKAKKKHVRRFIWSEMGDSTHSSPALKPMSEPSESPVAPSLALSSTPAVPLWNSFALFVSDTAFVFWDLCGIEFCILKVLPTGIGSGGGHFCRREQLRNCAA